MVLFLLLGGGRASATKWYATWGANALNCQGNLYSSYDDDDSDNMSTPLRRVNTIVSTEEIAVTDLSVNDYYTWTAANGTGEKVKQCQTSLVLNESTGLPFGDGTVNYLNYVDLSDAVNMVITATKGTPRILFNRVTDGGKVNVELPRDAATYWNEVDNGDGSKTYTVDIKKIVENYGFAHLHCIKDANFNTTTITSIKIGRTPKTYILTYSDLTLADYYRWTAADATGEKEENLPNMGYGVVTAASLIYGDGNVYYLNYADLTDAYNLEIVSNGTPRLLFNRLEDNGKLNPEINSENDLTYWSIKDNGDGTKTYTVDIAKIVKENGFAHLHAIKSAIYNQNVTVSSMKVGYYAMKGTTVKAVNKWGTFIAEVNCNIPEGMEIYTCEGIDENNILQLTKHDTFEPNTAYILYNTTDADLTIRPSSIESLAEQETYETGILTGVYAKTKVPQGSYILQNNNDVVGFYLCDTADFGLGKNRCYLTVPLSAGAKQAKALFFGNDGSTGMPTLEAAPVERMLNGRIYDLDGREHKTLQKGINVINGIKVNVK